jgi:hypothetical protein
LDVNCSFLKFFERASERGPIFLESLKSLLKSILSLLFHTTTDAQNNAEQKQYKKDHRLFQNHLGRNSLYGFVLTILDLENHLKTF